MDTNSWIEVQPDVPQPAAVALACRILGQGALAVLPTDTGYALCGNALDEAALASVYHSKGRDASKPLSVMVASLEMAREYVLIEDRVQRVIEALLPGPLTLVLPKLDVWKKKGESDTLGVRIPALPFTLAVLQRLRKPLTATSANPSGGPSPHRRADLGSCKALPGVAAIFDAGDLPHGRSSTIVEILPGQPPILLREGPLELSDVSAVL